MGGQKEEALFKENQYIGLSSTGTATPTFFSWAAAHSYHPPVERLFKTVNLEWTVQGYEAYQYWNEHFEELAQLGPLNADLVSGARAKTGALRGSTSHFQLCLHVTNLWPILEGRALAKDSGQLGKEGNLINLGTDDESSDSDSSDHASDPSSEDEVRKSRRMSVRGKRPQSASRQEKRKRTEAQRDSSRDQGAKKPRVTDSHNGLSSKERQKVEEEGAMKQLLQMKREKMTKKLELMDARDNVRLARAKLHALQARRR
jgi:hypothetical protein